MEIVKPILLKQLHNERKHIHTPKLMRLEILWTKDIHVVSVLESTYIRTGFIQCIICHDHRIFCFCNEDQVSDYLLTVKADEVRW